MQRSEDIYNTGSQLKKMKIQFRFKALWISQVNAFMWTYFPTETQDEEKAPRNLGVRPVFSIGSLVTTRASSAHFSSWLLCIAEAEQARCSDFAPSLKSGAALQKSSTGLNWETTARRNPSAKQFAVWDKHMLTARWNACLPPCANERAVDVIRVIIAETASIRGEGFCWPVLSTGPNGCWNCTTPSHWSCQLRAQMCYRKSMEELASPVALLSIAVQKPSASPTLRLGLFIKNQKREGRRKCVWFLVSSHHMLKMRSLEAIAAACIYSN